MEINQITHEIIGSLLVETQILLPLAYKGITIDAGYRLDLRVEGKVMVEVKAVEEVHPIHKAQLPCYVRLSGCRVGLILNFNECQLTHGITRMILD